MLSIGKDWHLRHCLKFLNEQEKKEFDHIAKRYLSDELNRLEHSLDDCLKRFSKLFLEASGEKLMDLHLRTQRALRDYSHRDHVNHMLGVWLLTTYLIQIDLDTLTLTRNINFKQRLIKENIPQTKMNQSVKFYPTEDTLMRYPDGEIFTKAFDPLDENKGKYYYADTFYFLFLFHDIGYLFELNKTEHFLKEEIDEVLLEEFNLLEYQKNDQLLRDTLKNILSFPFSSNSKRSQEFESLTNTAFKEFKEKQNHGVASSLILYRNFKNILLNKHTRDEDLFSQEAGPIKQKKYKKDFIHDCLGAICLHDLNFNQRISIQDSLHYFLLKFSDAICDWSRYYQGRKTFYPVQLIDEILLGFRPEERNNEKCVRINVVFDFSNLEALISEDIGEQNYEIEDFEKKTKELNQLDYTIKKNDCSEPYQWLFFEMILIDRNGERHKIDNEENEVKYSKIECPLFS
jgi:hypothetical protein